MSSSSPPSSSLPAAAAPVACAASAESLPSAALAAAAVAEAPRARQPGEAPIKPEFLKPIGTAPTRDTRSETGSGVENNADGRKRGGGTFKKRPADPAEDPAENLCRPVATGDKTSCAFGDACKFSHDVDAYMRRKPKDLGDRCPVFDGLGYCNDGLACRFAMAHVEQRDGSFRNVGRPAADAPKCETNALTNDVRTALRKNTYPFLSKEQRRSRNHGRHSKRGKGGEPAASSVPAEAATEVEAAAVADPVPALEPERRPVDFRRKIYVAPLTTVGNLPFRRLLKQTGADITCGEMALATNLLRAQQSEWALLRRHASEDVFGVQIAGAHGDQMARVCELLARETDVDFVDINMGCPIDLVCSAGAGAALMNRPPRMAEVISGALTGLELGTRRAEARAGHAPGLTVKLRTGWSEKSPVAHKLMSSILSPRGSSAYVNAGVASPDFRLRATQGVDAVMLHGRSRLQRYTRHADWDYIFQCADAAREALDGRGRAAFVGGGDVLSFEEFDAHLQTGRLDTCMLARGALIKPWLPTEIKERRHWDISAGERLDLLRDFVRFGLEHWGSDQKGVNRTRRYLLEWQSFLCRYIPVGLLEALPQQINARPAPYYGRSDLETLLASDQAVDWVKISEMLLGPVPDGFEFVPKHKANAYAVA